jgi:hypothetical protein
MQWARALLFECLLLPGSAGANEPTFAGVDAGLEVEHASTSFVVTVDESEQGLLCITEFSRRQLADKGECPEMATTSP